MLIMSRAAALVSAAICGGYLFDILLLSNA
jgi:hypothetical protein